MVKIKSILLGYGIGILSVGLTLVFKLWLQNLIIIKSPFSLWLVAIVISTWYGGRGSGLVSVFLSGLASHRFFESLSSPTASFSGLLADYLQLLLFIMEGLLVSTLTTNFKTTTRQSEIHKNEAKSNLQCFKQTQKSLRQTEELYRTLTQNLPNGAVFLFDRNLQFTSVDGPEVEVFGLSRENFEGKSLSEVFSTETYQILESAYHKTLDGEMTCVEVVCFDQVYLFQTLPVKDENGEISRGLAISQNITQRKKAESEIIKLNQALNQRFKDLKTLLEVIPIGIGISNYPQIQTIRINPAFAKQLGIDMDTKTCLCNPLEEGITGLKVFQNGRELLPEELPMQYSALHGVEVLDFEVELIRKDGKQINLLEYAAPLFDEEGKVRGCVGAFLDITQRKKAEIELNQREQEFRTLVENAPDIIFRYDQNLRHTYVNPAVTEITGKAPSHFLGKTLIELGASESFSQRCNEKLQYVLKTGEMAEMEIQVDTIQGKRCYLARLFPQFNLNGSVESVLGISRDLSEQKLIEEQLRKQTQELTQANLIKDEFMAVLSHELRTPIHNVQGWAELLLTEKELDEAIKIEALEAIERNARLEVRLIEDLLDMSRILKGEMKLEVETVDLAALINTAMDTIRLSAEAKNIEFSFTTLTFCPKVLGDTVRLQQVIWNLLSNAIKFTPKQGKVAVSLARVDSYAQITVTDTGKGISAEFLPHVFERFRQAEGSTTRSSGGLGLGLAIARHLIELHGGTIEAESEGEGKGSTFTLRLPLAVNFLTDSENNNFVSKVKLKGSIQNSFSLKNYSILVVDDDRDARNLIQTILESKGAKVLVAASVSEALTVFEQHPPDLLVSDIAMPIEDGYELIRQLRSHPNNWVKNLKAIALTAYAGEENERRILAAGFQRYLVKPVEPMKLINLVEKLLK